MAEVPLVGGVILNANRWALLLHRRDHNQLELPGGRIVDDEVGVQALARTLHMGLGIAVTSVHKLHPVPLRFEQHGVDYSCELYQVTDYEGNPWVVEPHLYGKNEVPVNLFTRQVGRQALSPVFNELIPMLEDGTIRLEGGSPVQ